MMSEMAILTINIGIDIAIVMLAIFERYVKHEADTYYRIPTMGAIGVRGTEIDQVERGETGHQSLFAAE